MAEFRETALTFNPTNTMTSISITEHPATGEPIQRLAMQLDTAPSPETLNRVIALLTAEPKPHRKLRSDSGKKRQPDAAE